MKRRAAARLASAGRRRLVEPAPRALGLEVGPLAFRLGQPVGQRVERHRVEAQADVTGVDLDVLGQRRGLIDAAAPGHDPIGLGVDRGGGHRRRLADGLNELGVVGRMATHQLEEAPGIGGARVAGEGRAQRDDAAHELRAFLGQLAGIDAAQAPAQQADLAVVAALQGLQVVLHPLQHAGARSEIEALAPGLGGIAERIEQGAQRRGAEVVGTQAGEDQHRVAVAVGQLAQPGRGGQQRGVFPGRAAFEHQQPGVGSTQIGPVGRSQRGRVLPARETGRVARRAGSGHAGGSGNRKARRLLARCRALAGGACPGLGCRLGDGGGGAGRRRRGLLAGRPLDGGLGRDYLQGLELQEGGLHIGGQLGGFGQGLAAGHQAHIQGLVVGLHRHVQRQAVHGDGGRVVREHLRAGQVERQLRAGHIGDDDVGDHRQLLGHLGAAVEQGAGLHQPGDAEAREVGGHQALELAHLGLHRLAGGHHMGQPLGRPRELGAQAHQRHRGLVVGGGVAGRTGGHRHGGDQALARQRAVLGQVAPQRAADDEEHRVVEAGAMALAGAVELGQRQRDAGEGARGRQAHIEAGARRRAQAGHRRPAAHDRGGLRGHIGQQLAQLGHRGARCRTADIAHREVAEDAGRVGQRAGEVQGLLPLLRHRRAQQADGAELAALFAPAGRRVDGARFGAQVQDHLRQRHGGLPVHGGMVQLGVERHPRLAVGPGLDAGEDMEFPQRPAAVQQHRVQPADLGLQHGHAAALAVLVRQRDFHDVRVQVGLGVHPAGVGHAQRHGLQLAAQGRQQGQAGPQVLAQVLDVVALVAGWQLQQVQRADMHRHLRRFQIQEAGVQAGKLLHPRSPCGQPSIPAPQTVAPGPTPPAAAVEPALPGH
mmetsp:Transcript_21663/g.84311  ORF Transcript_21663/g.84311 Transcript_21663/m.84311 type:complete len:879 (+) Transcript_21663:692-3328(+)